MTVPSRLRHSERCVGAARRAAAPKMQISDEACRANVNGDSVPKIGVGVWEHVGVFAAAGVPHHGDTSCE